MMVIPDNPEKPKAEIARIVAERARYSDEYYHIVGVKAFLDGVTEVHTAWQNQDYLDQPGYHGVERFNDYDKMVELITEADKEGLSVHVHSEGGGATHFRLTSLLPSWTARKFTRRKSDSVTKCGEYVTIIHIDR